MDGWAVFAARIITALKKYDEEHGTLYATYLNTKEGATALAEVMRKVDKQSQWEPILKGGPQRHD